MDQPLLESLAAFAQSHIAVRPELMSTDAFPFEIWKAMGDAGFMGLAIDPAYGGKGQSFADLSKAAERFAANADCPGLVMSWLGHNLMGRLLVEAIGTADQKAEWLPTIASGEVTVAVAISEPGAGAHPKHLSARADLVDDHYEIMGEKAFVTNGPIAGLFVVLAITGEAEGRKEFTAFLVPGNAPGISIRPMENPTIDFLKPCPHGLISFDHVRVPADNHLGPIGEGFDVVSKRVRSVEDAVGLGASAGNIEAWLRLLARSLSDEDAGADETLAFFGDMLPRLEGLQTLAAEAASAVDEGRRPSVGGAAGALAAEARRAILAFASSHKLEPSPAYQPFARDMEKSGNIARTARRLQAQKVGAAWLATVRD